MVRVGVGGSKGLYMGGMFLEGLWLFSFLGYLFFFVEGVIVCF